MVPRKKLRVWFVLMVSVLAVFTMLFMPASAMSGDTASPVFPVPKQWTDTGIEWEVFDGGAVISIPADASEPVEYAAYRLQTHIKNRFKITVPIVTGALTDPTAQVVLRIQTVPQAEGKFNGFNIRFININSQNNSSESGSESATATESAAGQCQAIVTGNDDNGTIYGSDVLFDLMKFPAERAADKPATDKPASFCLSAVEITDWPSIPWRGRPHFVLMQNLVPGALDAFVRARMNWTDVRDNLNYKVNIYYPDRAAPMGFPPGVKLDTENISKMVEQSHRRGLFVYGCVAAATNKRAGGIIAGFDKLNETNFYDDLNQAFEALLEMGCDGLWLSFDDIGQGNDPNSAIENFLNLGDKHGLSGRKLAYTPPLGDYNVIDTPFNHKTGKIDRFNEIQWFFTRVPCEADLKMSREIGLKLQPGWWHNLILLRPGFTNNSNIAVTLREGVVEIPNKSSDDKDVHPNQAYSWSDYPCEIPLPAYIELQPITTGWGAPRYEKIRNVPEYTDNVMLWCVGGGWPEEYLVTMIGNWAWAPETHDWNRMRGAIYSYVYGPDQVETAQLFDDTIVELKGLFHMPVRIFGPNKGWPCRLKNVSERQKALAIIDRLDMLAETLRREAPNQSAIDPQRLEYIYLEPMQTAVHFARKMAQLDYPEQTFDNLANRVTDLVAAGKSAEAERLFTDSKAAIDSQLESISRELGGLKGIDTYCQFWRTQLDQAGQALKNGPRINPGG